MKYGVLSDVHANWPALKSVYEDSTDVDMYIVLGDLVGLGGFPEEVVSSVRADAEHVLKGNHDIAVVENGDGHVNSAELSKFELETTMDALDDSQKDWISNLSSYRKLDTPSAVIAHAKPYPEESSGLNSGGVYKKHYPTAAANVNSDRFDFVLTGHTHDQAKLDCSDFGNNVTVVNPGSVGQPIKSGIAHYAVIDTEDLSVDLRTSEYDPDLVFERLESLDVPTKWWNRSVKSRRRRR